MELCLLPEEFEAILGLQLDFACQIVIPSLETIDLHSMQYQMARMFHFLPQTSRHHISSTEITMISLLDFVVAVYKKEVYWP